MDGAYNYDEEVANDVMEWLDENGEAIANPFGVVEYDRAYEELMNEDSVTGNASGSYTNSSWAAEENLCHNFHLLSEAVDEMGLSAENVLRSPEGADVTIRCYVLGQVLQDCLDKWNEEHAEPAELNGDDDLGEGEGEGEEGDGGDL